MAYGLSTRHYIGFLAGPTHLFFKQLRRMCCLSCFKYKYSSFGRKMLGPRPSRISDLTLLLDLSRKRATREVITHSFYPSWVVGLGGEGRVPCVGPVVPICAPPYLVCLYSVYWHSKIAFWFIPLLILSVICLFKGSRTRCFEANVHLSAERWQ